MELTVSQEQARVPVTVFHVKGDLTADSSDQLDQAARQAYDAGARYFVLDLAGVGYISSYGIRSISEILYMLRSGAAGNQDTEVSSAIRSGKQKSQHLKLAATTAQVQRVLATAGVDMFLDMYRDVKTALESF